MFFNNIKEEKQQNDKIVDIINFEDDDEDEDKVQDQQNQSQQIGTSGIFGIKDKLVENKQNLEVVDLENEDEEEDNQMQRINIIPNKIQLNLQEESKQQYTQQLNQPKKSQSNENDEVIYRPNQIVDMKSFLNTPIPEGKVMQCTLVRDTSGSNYFYPKYNLYLSDGSQYLMTAKKMSFQKTSYYLLSMHINDLSRQSHHFLGKLRSNFIGTEFTIYDQGLNPTKTQNLDKVRNQLGLILYENKILKTRGPKRMKVILPGLDEDELSIQFKELNPNFSLKNQQEKIVLVNKLPQWNDQIEGFVLNFSGRVTQGSVKNFQLIYENDEDNVIMQFGRSGSQQFNLDFLYPFSPLQAFSVCLTTFDHKLACD